MECTISAFSHAGGRERNEDACGYLESNGLVCCVLADGAGGHGGGHIASRLCVQSILDAFKSHPELSVAAIERLLCEANEIVLARQQQDASVADMHSTLVVLIFDPSTRKAVWGHVGDSRLYLFRHGSRYFRTRDHSLVQTMVDTGMISEQDALTHRERNILVASIGSRDSFVPTIIDRPFTLLDGDAFFLCSDGVWGLVDDQGIEKTLSHSSSLEQWLNQLQEHISSQSEKGSDNYSAIGVWCGEVDGMMRTVPASRFAH